MRISTWDLPESCCKGHAATCVAICAATCAATARVGFHGTFLVLGVCFRYALREVLLKVWLLRVPCRGKTRQFRRQMAANGTNSGGSFAYLRDCLLCDWCVKVRKRLFGIPMLCYDDSGHVPG